MNQSHSALEHDLLGDREVPADAYYGVHTLRALENFPITGTSDLDLPGPDRGARLRSSRPRRTPTASSACSTTTRADAIVARLPRRSAAGELHEQFVVDVIQGGAGTSTNMNANEVIANRALELLGHAQGRLRAPAPQRPRQHVRSAPTTSIRPRSSSRLSSASGNCCRCHGACCARRSRPRQRSSPTCSRSAAPSCRTRCR